jgi:malate dehydrogenase
MEPARVLVTGAAGQIGYCLSFAIARGCLLGNRRVILHLLEIEPALKALEGVVMELHDCAFPLLESIIWTTNLEDAFKGVDYAFLVGSVPRKDGMERSDLLAKNGGIFTVQGKALSDYSKPTVKALVVGNPCNTNCLIAFHSAPRLSAKNFCAMTRLDQNRAIGEIANRLGITSDKIHGVCIWGNHSATQVVDASRAVVHLPEGKVKVSDKIPLDVLQGEFCTKVATRGGAILKQRGASSSASAAQAAIDNMKDWIFGSEEVISMAIPVPDNQPYGVKKGTVFSFPVQISKLGEVSIIEGLELNDWVKAKILKSEEELIGEKKMAWEVLKL